MRTTGIFGFVIVAGLALGACSTGTAVDDVGTLWGEQSTAEQEAAESRAQAILARIPVQSVQSIEMGRTRDGFLITAMGTAAGLGYSLPTLRARRQGAPGVDGYIEYDFVAVAPPQGFAFPPGTTQSRSMRADLPVTLRQLQGASGLRVLALNGGVQMDF